MPSLCAEYEFLIEASKNCFLDYEVTLKKLEVSEGSRRRELLTKCVQLLNEAERAIINAAAHQAAHQCNDRKSYWEFLARRGKYPLFH